MTRIAQFDDEKRRREELAAYCRHVTAVMETFRYSLDQLNLSSQDQARRHIRKEMKRLFRRLEAFLRAHVAREVSKEYRS